VPDLVILDMIMDPGMDGLDAYRLMSARHPGLRVIITSGFSETQRVRAALRLGAGPYVRKPYRLETLARAVHEALAPVPGRP
jgi:DNA-binding NarL/FixJ family response regulator